MKFEAGFQAGAEADAEGIYESFHSLLYPLEFREWPDAFGWRINRAGSALIRFDFALHAGYLREPQGTALRTWACSVRTNEGDSVALVAARLCDAVVNACRKNRCLARVTPMLDEEGEWCGVVFVNAPTKEGRPERTLFVGAGWRERKKTRLA